MYIYIYIYIYIIYINIYIYIYILYIYIYLFILFIYLFKPRTREKIQDIPGRYDIYNKYVCIYEMFKVFKHCLFIHLKCFCQESGYHMFLGPWFLIVFVVE